MEAQNTSVNTEWEDIKAKLQFLGIMLVLFVPVFLSGMPMWLGLPLVAVGTLGCWYGVLKIKESKQTEGSNQ